MKPACSPSAASAGADLHPNERAHTRASLIEVEGLLEYQKPLANLDLQEQRLNRQHDRELAKLTALQTTPPPEGKESNRGSRPRLSGL